VRGRVPPSPRRRQRTGRATGGVARGRSSRRSPLRGTPCPPAAVSAATCAATLLSVGRHPRIAANHAAIMQRAKCNLKGQPDQRVKFFVADPTAPLNRSASRNRRSWGRGRLAACARVSGDEYHIERRLRTGRSQKSLPASAMRPRVSSRPRISMTSKMPGEASEPVRAARRA